MTHRPLRLPSSAALATVLAACSAPDCREFPAPGSSAAAAANAPSQHERIHTNRDGKQLLRLPKEDDAFGFVVFGDRTGGPKEGIEVLKQAVHDTNLLDPDLVFTVGDLVNGYNDQPAWLAQADEYKGAMAQLRMPWFPVAGNHDIYWRGKDKPQGEHEKDFESHFGPLWYAVEHKNCLFVSLYSDEGDPATGRKDFTDPKCQRMSDAQFAWLTTTLTQHRDKRHVFVFLHHPRWLEARYPGADWERVHGALVAAKNVTAVFGGHMHRMRFDGVRDGIQYFTIASVGAFLDLELPRVGFLHEFHVVTVRDEGIQLAALPVGTVMDPKAITGAMSDDVEALHTKLAPRNARGLQFAADGGAVGEISVDFDNPASQTIELTLLPEGDEAWSFGQDHVHAQIAAGGSATVRIAARRVASAAMPTMPSVVMRVDYLAGGLRIALPETRAELALVPGELPVPHAGADGSIDLDGSAGTCLRVEHDALRLPQGPLTVEAWVRVDDTKGRRAVVSKAQSSEFGLYCNDGKPHFSIRLGKAYVSATAPTALDGERQWRHLAGVYDEREVRLYVDGKLVAKKPGAGARATNRLPMFVGADPTAKGAPESFLDGAVQHVRVSTVARYEGDRFAPPLQFACDEATALWLPCASRVSIWTPDASGRGSHARLQGNARCVEGSR